MTHDWFMRQIEDMTRVLAKILFDRMPQTEELFETETVISQSDFLYYRLQKLMRKAHINEAENLLFEQLEEDKSAENLKVAIAFYEGLQEMSEEQLQTADFSREEIYEGLKAVKELYDIKEM